MERLVYMSIDKDKNPFFSKSKERLGWTNKGFLTILLSSNEHKPIVDATTNNQDHE